MNSPIAKYTESFYEFLKRNPNYLSNTIVLSSQEKSNKLIEMITSTFNVYEIGSETEDLFKLNFEDTFKIWRDFYEEKIKAYEKEYDYALGNRKRTIHSKSIDLNSKKSSRSGDFNKHTDIELPNKRVSESYEEVPSAINRDESSRKVDDTVKAGTLIDDSDTTIYDDEFLDLKRKYMEQITNIYLEFANKFKECFIMIY